MCPDQRVLSAYLDGELEARWRAKVERHVKGCAACTARLAGLRSLSVALARDVTPGLASAMKRVRAALAATSRRVVECRRLVSVPMPVALAAATLVVALGGALVYSLLRPASSLPRFSASRLVVEAYADEIRRLLALLDAKGSERTVVFDIPQDFPLAPYGEPQFRSVTRRSAE
jgi:anti-sigma factor RsiW